MTTLVLVGPHGAGKTSLGQALSALTGWAFHDEIGRRLAEDPTMRPAEVSPADAQARFDAEVFRRERERDVAWPAGAPRIVETWHPGNLAYAALRSPSVWSAWADRLRDAIDGSSVCVLPVAASLDTLATRQSEPGDLDFFVRVGERALEEARRLGVRIAPEVRTDETGPTDLARQVSRRIASFFGEVRDDG